VFKTKRQAHKKKTFIFKTLEKRKNAAINFRMKVNHGAAIKSAPETKIEASRFPALGQKKFSFDNFLRKQITNRIRRSSEFRYSKRLKVIKPEFAKSRQVNSLRLQTTASTRRSMILRSKANAKKYLTKQQRNLARAGKALSKIAPSRGKTSLVSLPCRLLIEKGRQKEGKVLTLKNNQLGASEVILQEALKKRYYYRQIRDLRKQAQRRVTNRKKIPFF
jgi:hypothetical protein